MAYDYGYGELENELIELFHSGAPDFEKAEELIKKGADINARGNSDCENILSESLRRHWNKKSGEIMCDIIRFFLKNGFDVNKYDGCYGAQCLFSITLSSYDRYMLEAIKILMDAGARNRKISDDANESDTPWDFIATEGSYQGCCEGDHNYENLYEAAYQIYLAVDEGREYRGIDSYEAAVGKRINKIIAEDDGNPTFYPINLPGFKKHNCYTKTLYFVFDGGVLITTQFGDFWVDTVIPDKKMIDVSESFPEVVGSVIKDFKFNHKKTVKGTTQYGRPITTVSMSSGKKLVVSTNFGMVEEEDKAAFFEILK